MALTTQQNLLKKIAETIMLKPKIERQILIRQMHEIIQQITQDQLIEVIRLIDSPLALRFMLPAGVYDQARLLTQTKIVQLEAQRA